MVPGHSELDVVTLRGADGLVPPGVKSRFPLIGPRRNVGGGDLVDALSGVAGQRAETPRLPVPITGAFAPKLALKIAGDGDDFAFCGIGEDLCHRTPVEVDGPSRSGVLGVGAIKNATHDRLIAITARPC